MDCDAKINDSTLTVGERQGLNKYASENVFLGSNQKKSPTEDNRG